MEDVKLIRFLKAITVCYSNNGHKPLCKKCIAYDDVELCKTIPLDRTTMKFILEYFEGED